MHTTLPTNLRLIAATSLSIGLLFACMGQGCSDAAVVQATPSDDSNTDYGAVLGYRPDAPPIVPEAPAATGDEITDAGSGTDDGSTTTTDPIADGDTVVVAKPDGGPTGLSLAAVSGQIALSWNDGASNEDGFAIRRYTSAQGWIDLVSAPADTTTYTDATVQVGMTYCYDLAAFNEGGYVHAAVRCLTAVSGASGSNPDTSTPAAPAGQVQLSGIVHADGRPMAAVVVRAGSAAPVLTDAAGRYRVNVSAGWSGQITAHWDDALFSPAVQEVTNALTSRSGIDFAAHAPAPTGPVYYVGSDGVASNDGSRARPWPTVEHALSQTGGGATILLKPGYYKTIRIAATASGTPQQPTVIKAEIKWTAVIIGPESHGVYSLEYAVDQRLHDVVLDGLQIDGRDYEQISYDGLHFMYDDRITIRNCWIHHCRHMGVAMHYGDDNVMERNLIEWNGWGPTEYTQPPEYPDVRERHFHAVYASGSRLIARSNVIRHHRNYGLHFWPEVRSAIVENNVIWDHAVTGGAIIVTCPENLAGGGNRVVNNTLVHNIMGVDVWYGNGEVVANNLVVDSQYPFYYRRDTANLINDYNMTDVPAKITGPHSFASNPLFASSAADVFFLSPASSAIDHGSPDYAPATDFWGRPQPAGSLIGALPAMSPEIDPAGVEGYDWWAVPVE